MATIAEWEAADCSDLLISHVSHIIYFIYDCEQVSPYSPRYWLLTPDLIPVVTLCAVVLHKHPNCVKY